MLSIEVLDHLEGSLRYLMRRARIMQPVEPHRVFPEDVAHDLGHVFFGGWGGRAQLERRAAFSATRTFTIRVTSSSGRGWSGVN